MKKSENKDLAKLTKEERKFIEIYRKLSEEEKREVLQIINDKSQIDATD